jgi:hypothetical protein
MSSIKYDLIYFLISILGFTHCISCSPTHVYEELSFINSYYFTPLVPQHHVKDFRTCQVQFYEELTKKNHQISFTQRTPQDDFTYFIAHEHAQWLGDLNLSIVDCPIQNFNQSSLFSLLQRLNQKFDLKGVPNTWFNHPHIIALWKEWTHKSWSTQITEQNYRHSTQESNTRNLWLTPWHFLPWRFEYLLHTHTIDLNHTLSSTLSSIPLSLKLKRQTALSAHWSQLWGLETPWLMMNDQTDLTLWQKNLGYTQQSVSQNLGFESAWHLMQVCGFLIELSFLIKQWPQESQRLQFIQWHTTVLNQLQALWAESWRATWYEQSMDQEQWWIYQSMLTWMDRLINLNWQAQPSLPDSSSDQSSLNTTLWSSKYVTKMIKSKDLPPIIHWNTPIPRVITTAYTFQVQIYGVSAPLDRIQIFYRTIDGLKPLAYTEQDHHQFQFIFNPSEWNLPTLDIIIHAWDQVGRVTQDSKTILVSNQLQKSIYISGQVIDWRGSGVLTAFAWPSSLSVDTLANLILNTQEIAESSFITLAKSQQKRFPYFTLLLPTQTEYLLLRAQADSSTLQWNSSHQQWQSIQRDRWFLLHTQPDNIFYFIIMDRFSELLPLSHSTITHWQNVWQSQSNAWYQQIISLGQNIEELTSHWIAWYDTDQVSSTQWNRLPIWLQKRYAIQHCMQGRDLWWHNDSHTQLQVDQQQRLRVFETNVLDPSITMIINHEISYQESLDRLLLLDQNIPSYELIFMTSLLFGCGIAEIMTPYDQNWSHYFADELTRLLALYKISSPLDFESFWNLQSIIPIDSEWIYTTVLNQVVFSDQSRHGVTLLPPRHQTNRDLDPPTASDQDLDFDLLLPESPLNIVSDHPLCYHMHTKSIYSYQNYFYTQTQQFDGIHSLRIERINSTPVNSNWNPTQSCSAVYEDDILITQTPRPCFWTVAANLEQWWLTQRQAMTNNEETSPFHESLQLDNLVWHTKIPMHSNGSSSIGIWQTFTDHIEYPLACQLYIRCQLSENSSLPHIDTSKHQISLMMTPWLMPAVSTQFIWHTLTKDLTLQTECLGCQLNQPWERISNLDHTENTNSNDDTHRTSHTLLIQDHSWSLDLYFDRPVQCMLKTIDQWSQDLPILQANEWGELQSIPTLNWIQPPFNFDLVLESNHSSLNLPWETMICSLDSNQSAINDYQNHWKLSASTTAQSGIFALSIQCQDRLGSVHQQYIYGIQDKKPAKFASVALEFYPEVDYDADRIRLQDQNNQIDIINDHNISFDEIEDSEETSTDYAYRQEQHILDPHIIQFNAWFDRWSTHLCEVTNHTLEDVHSHCLHEENPLWLTMRVQEDMWEMSALQVNLTLWTEDSWVFQRSNQPPLHVLNPNEQWHQMGSQTQSYLLYQHSLDTSELQLDLKKLIQSYPYLWPSLGESRFSYLQITIQDPSAHQQSIILPIWWTSILPPVKYHWDPSVLPSLQERWQNADWSIFQDSDWGILQLINPHSIPLWVQINEPTESVLRAEVQEYDYGIVLQQEVALSSCLFDQERRVWSESLMHLAFVLEGRSALNGYCRLRPSYELTDLHTQPIDIDHQWYHIPAYSELEVDIDMPQWNLTSLLSNFVSLQPSSLLSTLPLNDIYALFDEFALYWREEAICDTCSTGIIFGTPYLQLQSLTWSHTDAERWHLKIKHLSSENIMIDTRTTGTALTLPWAAYMRYQWENTP